MSASTIICYGLLVLVGAVALWYKSNAKLNTKVAGLISAAEQEYADTTKAGLQKFEWVVSQLYNLIPAPVRPFIPRELIASVVQSTFDAIQGYAIQQLNRLADKIIETEEQSHA